MTISVSGGLGLLQMVSESQTLSSVSAKTLVPEGRWIVRSHIDWREERVPARMLGPEGG